MSSKLWTEEQFNCPVCLDLPNDPVTIPCGHSYCMGCIKDYWSKDDPKGVSCPQCRETFCPKPTLSRNTMLAEAVEQLRKGALKADVRESMRNARSSSGAKGKPSAASSSSSTAVPCDMCKGEQRAAVKSCLSCMTSFCAAHLKPHNTKKALKAHELIAPTANLAEKICTQHKYLQEFFCRQCKMFVCWLCTSNQHKGHECVSTKVERLEKQNVLSEMQTENQQRLKVREQELKDMKKMMEGMKRSADRVHGDTEQALGELQRSMERLQELLEEALDQAGLEKMGQAQEVVDSLEAEVKELRRRETQMRDLSLCEDHIHYLEACESVCSPLESGDLPAVTVNHDASFEPAREAILDLRDRVEDLCNQELGKITKQVNDTTLFTLKDSNRSGGAKGGILKLFRLGPRNTNTRPPAATPSISVGARLGIGVRSQDVRSRDAPRADRGNTSSPRLQDRQRREERETVRETNPRPSSSPRPSPTPSRREPHSQSLWSRSSQSQAVPANIPTPIPATPTPAPAPAPAPASSGGSGFSRMASISSLFRSHRRGTTPASPAGNTLPAGGNPWGMAALSETPTEINPGLFLDLPTPVSTMHAPTFPALREISLDSIQAPEPRSREEFLQYSVSLTLDTDTAHRRLVLAEGNTKATLQPAPQPYPDTPQRFDGWTQVMCSSPLYAQRCYWEVEWRGRGSSVGVVYGAMARKGTAARSGLGYNAQSWTLELSDTCCSAMHDNEKRDMPVTYSPRLGLFLDLSTGTLAFYSVAENMTHLHTFRANFTQPLYAAFGVGSGVGVGLDFALGQFSSSSDSIKICPM